jgi:uncharacterized membrane protein
MVWDLNKKIIIVLSLLIVIALGVLIYVFTQPQQPVLAERIVIGVTDKVTDLDPQTPTTSSPGRYLRILWRV